LPLVKSLELKQHEWSGLKMNDFRRLSTPALTKELATDAGESYKNHLESQPTITMACRAQIISSRSSMLQFRNLFTSWLCTVLIILIFLWTHSAVNPSVSSSSSNFVVPSSLAFLLRCCPFHTFRTLRKCARSRGSSGSIVSDYGLDGRAIGVRSPAGPRIFPLSSVSSPALGPTQPPVQWVPGVLSPGVKRGRGVTLTTHLHLVPRLRMSRSYTSSPPKRLHGV
jgi:hypothetical protein